MCIKNYYLFIFKLHMFLLMLEQQLPKEHAKGLQNTGASQPIRISEKGQYFLSLISESETIYVYRCITHKSEYVKPLFLEILTIMAYRE